MRTKKKSTEKLAAEQRQRRQGLRAAHEMESLVGVLDKNPKKSRSNTRTKVTSNSRVSGQRIDKASIKHYHHGYNALSLERKKQNKIRNKKQNKKQSERNIN